MKKTILAFLTTLVMVCAMVGTAYAAGLSAAEQKVLDKFEKELQYWVDQTKDSDGPFDEFHKNQYYTEARNALVAVDLTDAACKEFEGVVDQVHQVFVDHNCKTDEDLWECYPEISKIINDVGAKYYKLHVTVSDHARDETGHCGDEGHLAKVTYELPSGQQSVAASTGNVVKQTGFSLGRTVGVVVVAVSSLMGAYVVARKKLLTVG